MLIQRKLFSALMYPADGDGGDLGGASDRGDDLLPSNVEKFDKEEIQQELDLDLDEDKKEDETEKPADADVSEEDEVDKPKKSKSANERIQDLITKNKSREAEYQAKIKELEENQVRVKLAEDLSEVENTLSEMEEKYAQLLMDGEAKQATQLRSEIRKLEKAVYTQQARLESTYAKDAAKEEIRYDSTISSLENVYPEINPDSESYDSESVQEILSIHRGLVSQGLPPSLSIQRAVKYVLGVPNAGDTSSDKGLQRVKDTKVRNADAAKRQPASSQRVGVDSDKMGGGLNEQSVLKMNYDDFSKLSDDALAKMRGDYV